MPRDVARWSLSVRPTLILVAALATLAGCEGSYPLPGGGTVTLSPTEPVNAPAQSSNAQACVARDIRGQSRLTARYRCRGDADGVIRDR